MNEDLPKKRKVFYFKNYLFAVRNADRMTNPEGLLYHNPYIQLRSAWAEPERAADTVAARVADTAEQAVAGTSAAVQVSARMPEGKDSD